jgi:Sigma 54 modulation protein / S30EA ribosomal protein
MAFPIEIRFRETDPDPKVEDLVRELAARLEHVYDGILRCEVAIEVPHNHGRRPHVRITLHVTGTQIVISRDPTGRAAPEDAAVAVHDAFHAARRKLEAWVKRDLRREVKQHSSARGAQR